MITAFKIMLIPIIALIGNVVLPVLIGAFVDDYHFTLAQSSLLASVYMLGGAIGPWIVGSCLNLVETRRLVGLALAMISIGNLLTAFAMDYNAVAMARFVAGLGEGSAMALAFGAMARLPHPDRKFAYYMTALQVATGLAYLALPMIHVHFGVRALMLTIAASPLIAMFSVPSFPDLSNREANVQGRPAPIVTIPPRIFWMVIVGTFVAFAGYGGLWTMLERIGVGHGIESTRVTNILALGGFISALSAFAAQWGEGTNRRRIEIILSLGVLCLSTNWIINGGGGLSYGIAVTINTAVWFYFVVKLLAFLAELDGSGRLAIFGGGALGLGLAAGPLVAAGLVGGSFAMIGLACTAALIFAGGLLISSSLMAPRAVSLAH